FGQREVVDQFVHRIRALFADRLFQHLEHLISEGVLIHNETGEFQLEGHQGTQGQQSVKGDGGGHAPGALPDEAPGALHHHSEESAYVRHRPAEADNASGRAASSTFSTMRFPPLPMPAKSPRNSFRAYRSYSISVRVRTPRRRRIGKGGHHPSSACQWRNMST